jgi:LmbE family N-acetylglucosaminyl deacetylase
VIPEEFTVGPVALIVAHPDDETIGAGGVIPQLNRLLIVHITDGAPRGLGSSRAEFAQLRRRELMRALQIAGISPEHTRTLDYVDQEAMLDMAGLGRRIAGVLEEYRPSAVLTHPYEGGHPDHDATAFGVHMACALQTVGPPIYEFPCYHTGLDGSMETGCFLPGQDPGEAVILSSEECERKTRMFECFRSQEEVLRMFAIGRERFRRAPAYDFTGPPHAGKVWYENWNWGVTGERWRRLAEEAMEAA